MRKQRDTAVSQTSFKNSDAAMPVAHELKFPFPVRLVELGGWCESPGSRLHGMGSNCDGNLDPPMPGSFHIPTAS